MIKTLLVLVFSIIPSLSFAMPVMYTFSGMISAIGDVPTGSSTPLSQEDFDWRLLNLGLSVGSEVSYQVVVDRDREGNDWFGPKPGETVAGVHVLTDTYYADLVGGPQFELDLPSFVQPQHIVIEATGTLGRYMGVDQMIFTMDKLFGSELELGDVVQSNNWGILGDLMITDISSVNVPEPHTALMLAFGICFLRVMKTKRSSQSDVFVLNAKWAEP